MCVEVTKGGLWVNHRAGVCCSITLSKVSGVIVWKRGSAEMVWGISAAGRVLSEANTSACSLNRNSACPLTHDTVYCSG